MLITREPGSGTVGSKIREILLHSEAIDSRCELFMFLADRADHVTTVLRPGVREQASRVVRSLFGFDRCLPSPCAGS